MAHSTSTAGLLVRVVVAFALTYVLGYERELRGSPRRLTAINGRHLRQMT